MKEKAESDQVPYSPFPTALTDFTGSLSYSFIKKMLVSQIGSVTFEVLAYT